MARRKVTNDLIAIMIVALVAISLISFLPLLRPTIVITGAQTLTATTQLTVPESTGCSFVDSTINFGTVEQDINNYSEQGGVSNPEWVLQNTGTVNISSNLTINGADWLFTAAAGAQESTYWEYKCESTLSGTCTEAAYTPVVDGTTNETLITDLRAPSNLDNATLYNNVTVPNGESTGAKTGTVRTFCWKDE